MQRIPSLDGLRGVAIALVVVFHYWPKFLPAGAYGVTVFFVLSGYLITRILVADLDNTGFVDFRRFYARRARRLFPALVLFAAVMLAWSPTWSQVWPTLAYGANIARIQGADLGALGHTWSLAVEEHFYVVWPLALVAIPRRWRLRATIGMLGFAVVWRVILSDDFVRAKFGTDSAAFALLAGCAVALWRNRPAVTERTGRIALAGIVAASALPLGESQIFLLVEIPVAALTVLVILACLHGPMPQLERSALRWLGTVSYGLYLWHFPFQWTRPMIGLPVALLITAVSWKFVEEPWLRRQPAQLPAGNVNS